MQQADTPVETPAPATPAAAENPAISEEPAPTTMQFTDSVGRTVELPANITKVAVSGPLSQIALFALCPDKLVGLASAWDATAEQYIATEYYNLPELGQFYGSKGELNLEALLQSGAEVVIDVGEPKDTIVEDLDALEEQMGIPFVHITATTATMSDAYIKLGELLNMREEAEVLAEYCTKVYNRTLEIANSVEKANVVYCLGDTGLTVIAKGSFHGEIIDLIANNLAVVDAPSSKGTGNETDLEQLLLWNPDVILFAPDSVYQSVGQDAAWQEIKAIKNGTYYEVPFGPYNFIGFPPSVQRYLGMMWMTQLLYPDTAQYDLYSEVANYFKLFYHSDLTQAQYDALMTNSIGAQQAAKPAA
ncbi:MAG TPA: ABC transporter substrate-binding protein [Clostridia bacterium]|nr:ABC transporter substrate-binding protein [Clostridia bacterium]